MGDVLYVTTIVAFFAVMLAYIKGCAALGKEETSEVQRT